ncbi:MAG: PIN domain-containing protein [Lachnospiraceae bacterium]|nr:PIN domain-containing protein [Clostridia bacterium]MBP3200762.1 PIN domain-containing protein [Lachnospiraceae bacterium]
MKKICDANIILRYLIKDDENLFDIAKKEIQKCPIVPIVILAEIVYVLKGIYKVSRNDIVDTLITLSDEVEYEDINITLQTLNFFKNLNLDFADCYLLARNKINKEEIVTFDNKLNKELNK